ncbi:MAG TPA: hypothetical protein VJ853_05205, partial [Thermoanaerobaculia bacterium]|nr:hypothetical protein [Thermoanaerobaculia bacterium]
PELGQRAPRPQRSQAAVGAELARRHAETLAELLTEVILGIKTAATGDLRHAQITGFEKSRRFAQPFLFQKMTEQPAGDPMKTSGHILSRVAEFLGDRFDGDFFIVAESAPDALQKSAE